MSPRKKGAILSFVQSGNFELLSQTGFEPGTLRVAVPVPSKTHVFASQWSSFSKDSCFPITQHTVKNPNLLGHPMKMNMMILSFLCDFMN